KLSLEEIQGGTFTITSIGSIGGLFATPIINYPEVAILGINKIQERPVVRGGQIVARYMTYLSLTLDHRVVDGSEAAYFMNRLIGYLSDPKRMLLL
ncbi:MAG: 2-oxo acid dehydrogenase subunit E2, partial [Deltaproteobacteria bacterium]|nr:2-oxo acid dehydrogenase subunit E2 [Deltaproteobacteria bacterium]